MLLNDNEQQSTDINPPQNYQSYSSANTNSMQDPVLEISNQKILDLPGFQSTFNSKGILGENENQSNFQQNEKIEQSQERAKRPAYRISSSKTRQIRTQIAEKKPPHQKQYSQNVSQLQQIIKKEIVLKKDESKVEQQDDQDNLSEEKDQVNGFQDDINNLALKKQSVSANNQNYQTASFGGLKMNETGKIKRAKQQEKQPLQQTTDQMFTSMSDIGFSQKFGIITKDLRDKLTDQGSNWKIRTESIDEILKIISEKVEQDPQSLQQQSEPLMEFFISLLGDQNFKIVLTTMQIINILLSNPAQNIEGEIGSVTLARYIPQLIKKLGDSKNIIRSEAIRALISIYDIMKLNGQGQSNFIGLLIPYLGNSQNWRIREELLNVLIVCFLKSRNFYEFDAFQVVEALIKLLADQKDRIKQLSLEAIVTYASIGNKFSVKEIVYQLVDKEIYDAITERMDIELVPFINEEGALEVPYLDNMEINPQPPTSSNSAMILPNLNKKDSVNNSTTINKAQSSNPGAYQNGRGNSSGRRVIPPSANSIQNAIQISKRTVSANYQKTLEGYYQDQNNTVMYDIQNSDILYPGNILNQPSIGMGGTFLPSLTHNNSQQYPQSHYISNPAIIQGQVPPNPQLKSYMLGQLQMGNKLNNDSSFGQYYQNQMNGISPLSKGSSQASQQIGDMAFSTLTKQMNENMMNQISISPQISNFQQFQQLNYNQDQSTTMQSIQSRQSQRNTAIKSRQTPYEQSQQNAYPLSQKQSRGGIGYEEQITPIRSHKNNGNTFYSDGSFTTTSTSIAEKLKALKQNKRFTVGVTIQEANQIRAVLQNQQNNEDMPEYALMNQGIIRTPVQQTRGGPIRATRAALKRDDSQDRSFQQEQTPQNEVIRKLCIDSRKSKSTKTKPNQDIQDLMNQKENPNQTSISYFETTNQEDSKYSPLNTKNKFSMMRRTNFGSESDDPNQKYVTTEELEPLQNPDKEFKKYYEMINRNIDWSAQFESCNIIRRICKHHSSIIISQGAQLHTIVTAILKIADSLRSSLSKIALMTLNDMFVYLKRCIEPDLDNIIKQLLKKATDTNIFISEEAEKSLIVKSLGNNVLFFKDNDRLINSLALFLGDACQEVRNTAKNGFLQLSSAIMGQNDLEKLLQRVLNENQYKKVKDFLEKEPTYLTHMQQQQTDFLITNANSHFQQKPKANVKQNPKGGQLRQASLNKNSVQLIAAEQPLNIQATKILKPSQIKKKNSSLSSKPDSIIDQFFIDTMKDLILQTQTSDWKQRLDSLGNLFDFIEANQAAFQNKQSNKLVEIADTICRLFNDQNAKIQQSSLEKFIQLLPSIFPFIEAYLNTFLQALVQNLGINNTSVKRQSESIMQKVSDNLDKALLVQPLINLIQFQSNARLKPILIDFLSDLLIHLQENKNNILTKVIQPFSYKLMDDNKAEVKQKTDKFLRNLYQIVGQIMIDQCPQVKLQRLCDTVLGGQNVGVGGLGIQGGGQTFGPSGVQGIIGKQ